MTAVSSIYDDSKDINTLLFSAKMGRWNAVWRVLGSPSNPRKAHLLNCIPENRRWSVLHQAIWWNNYNVVIKLLQFDTCDASIQAKEGASEIGQDGRKTAEQIAEGFGRTGIVKLLQNNESRIQEQIPETFQLVQNETGNYILGLLRITLASYKIAFEPRSSDQRTFHELLYSVFVNINTVKDRWKLVRDKVCEAVYVVCDQTCEKLKECSTKEEFFRSIINTYTEESTYLYDHLNTALRRQRQAGYRPTAHDLALGPYVLMYQMLILFWDELQKEHRKTYRRMKVTEADLQRYQVGTRFAWMSFVSSSLSLQKAVIFPTLGVAGEKTIVFTIDNTCQGQHQPRNIEKYAQYMEQERVYPAGSKFIVTRRTEHANQTNISLKLLNN